MCDKDCQQIKIYLLQATEGLPRQRLLKGVVDYYGQRIQITDATLQQNSVIQQYEHDEIVLIF